LARDIIPTAVSKTLALLPGMLLCSLPLHAEIGRAELVQLGASVLKVEVRRGQGGYSLGSGVVVGADRVVTNCHVTRDGVDIHVLRGDQRWRVAAQASDVEHDLCVLRVPDLQASQVALGKADDLKALQSVTAIGYTGGVGLQISAGAVVALHRYGRGQVIQSSNWFSSGASGGGLFDDHQRLVGVLTFRMRGGAAHYYAAPVEWLRPLLVDETLYLPVAPADQRLLSYWQQPLAMQPRFLQASALEREQKWIELETLASGWSLTDADDPAPWYLQGVALDRLNRPLEAQRAFERSLALAPASAATWYRLGLLLLRQPATERLREVRRQLEALDPALLLELDLAIGKT
jgi:serine protease Do